MFDDLAARPPRSRRRQAGAAMLALLLPLTALTGLALAGQQSVTPVDAEPPVEVSFVLEAPPPMPAPARAAAPGPAKEAAPPPPQAEAPEPPEPAAEPDDDPDPQADDEPPPPADGQTAVDTDNTGGGGGCEGPDCDPEGCVGPDCEQGTCVGPHCGSGPRAVHWSEIQVRRQVPPRFPPAARQLGVEEATCQLRFFVDIDGRPADVRVEQCPPIFQSSALEAAWKWRFTPMEVDGEPVPAQFVLAIHYRLR